MCLGIKSVEAFLTLLLFSECFMMHMVRLRTKMCACLISRLSIKIIMYFLFYFCLIINNVLLRGQE